MRTRTAVATIAFAVLGAMLLVVPSDATTATEHGYVTSTVVLPVAANDALALGRDLTGDGKADNQLGKLLAALVSQGLDLQAWNADVRSGRIVMLQSLRARSLATDRQATWQLWYGVPVSHPNLTGTGTFKAGTTHSARIPARIVSHHLSTSATTIPVRMDLGSGVFAMPLLVGRAFATCYSASCGGGRINGAVRSSVINTTFVPQLALILQAIVDRDCPVDPAPRACLDGSSGASVEQIFDAEPKDFVITADELRHNNLIKGLLAPDVDLYRADGTRGTDGKPDSMSFGFGFRAVKAKIVH